VLLGINRLSQKDPDWFMSISVAELNLASGGWDILGQWDGCYPNGLATLYGDGRDPASREILEGWMDQAYDHGFAANGEDERALLEEVWGNEIHTLKREYRVKQLAGGEQ